MGHCQGVGSVMGTFSVTRASESENILAIFLKVGIEYGLGEFILEQAMLLNKLPKQFPIHLELLDIVLMEIQYLTIASTFIFLLDPGSTTWRLSGCGVEVLSDGERK